MKKIIRFVNFIACSFIVSINVAAESFESSKIATGTIKLIQDLTNWGLILAPIIGALFVIYFFIRRGAADEADQKQWNKRIGVALVSTVGAVLATAIIQLVVKYYA